MGTHTVGPGCGEKTEKRGICDTHTVGPVLWRER